MRTHRGSFPALCSALHHVPGIAPGVRLSRQQRDLLLSMIRGFQKDSSSATAADDARTLFSGWVRAGSYHVRGPRQVRQISPDKDVNHAMA